MFTTKKPGIATLFFICLFVFSGNNFAASISETETVSDDLDVFVNKYQAVGKELLLWVAPSFGFRKGHTDMAELLQLQGFEVWMADINEALFLPHNSTAMRDLKGTYVTDLVTIAHQKTGKDILLISGSYGAIPVLRGAREWLLTNPNNRYLLGIFLFSPSVYQSIPPLGTEPKYLPIVFAINLPIVIFQGSMNSNRWQVEKLATALRSGDSRVHVEIMPNVVGLFYEEERQPHVEKYFQELAGRFTHFVALVRESDHTLRAKPLPAVEKNTGTGLDSHLRQYKGDPQPLPINLKDISGKSYKLDNFKNQVTIINFWATWCPPCVKEIPSLNNLRNAMHDKPFQLISVNYAEQAETIKEFLNMVQVDFPVLLDPDGKESAKWKVIAFPSTFVIGPDGLVRYGVNAGIEWDTPEVIDTLNRLFTEK